MALHLRRLASLALFAAAIGCPKPVDAPVAKINDGTGTIAGISVGQLVHLDGTGSVTASPGGRDLTFEWSFARLPVGSAATLNDAHSQTPSFVADVPSTDASNTYVVRLVVSNAFVSSAPVTTTITVSACGGRAPVIAALNATPPAGQTTFGVGSLVSLSASVTDPDNQTADQICAVSQNQTVTYLWKLVGQPASSTSSLNNPTAVAPSFVADVAGDYTLRLVTTDSTGRSSTPFDSKVTVSNCGANAPTITSVSPVTEQFAVSKTIQMTAIVDDADNDATCKSAGTPSQALTYAWSLPQLPNGSRAVLNSASAQNASFTPDLDGDYSVRLVVSDSTGRSSAPRDTGIHITKCGNNAPTASIFGVAIAPATTVPAPFIGGLLQFGATILDADQDSIGGNPPACNPIIPQSYSLKWALRATPAGSVAQLNNPTSTQPSFTPDVSGSYKVELVVTDQSGLSSAPASATVAVSSCGNNRPSATITGTSTFGASPSVIANGASVNGGAQIALSISGGVPSDLDNAPAGCNLHQTFTYAWSLSSRPPNSSAFIVNPTADPSVAPASFTADVANGNYQVQLVVSDSAGFKSVPSFFNVLTNGCGTNAPTIASATAAANGVSVNITAPNPGQPVTLTAAGADADNGAACTPALSPAQGLSYQWTLVSRPTSSSTTLTTATATTATFTPDAIGSYQFSVVVTDSTGLKSAPTYVTVGTSSCGSHTPAVASVTAAPSSVQPLPNPGSVSPARVTASTVTLSASVSDGDDACFGGVQPRTYVWSVVQRPAGSSAVLSDPTSATPAFIPDVTGDYQFQIVVTDSLGLASTPAFVNVHATSCSLLPPAVLPLSSPTNPTQLVAVTLPAPAFSAAPALQNCVATPGAYVYRWSMVAEPAGSQSVLDNPASPSPRFTPDKVGAYVVSVVVVNDAGIAADPVYLQVLVGTCGSTPLGWSAAAITSTFTDPNGATTVNPEVGAQVKLIPHPTDSNTTCGTAVTNALSYKWAIIAAPAGSRAALTSTTEASPTFVPDVQGTYQISAIATDGLGNQSSAPGFITVATGSCGANVPTVTITPSDLTGIKAINSYALQAVSVLANDADNTPSCPARFHTVGFTYAWSLVTTPVGGHATISSSSGASTTFEATSPGQGYQLRVVATGSNGLSSDPTQAAAFLGIDVAACGSHAPVVSSVATLLHGTSTVVSRPAVGTNVDLVVNATDADDSCTTLVLPKTTTLASYTLRAISLPSGSAVATFARQSASAFSITPDVAGAYTFSLTATDDSGLESLPVQLTLTTAACGPVQPTFTATMGGVNDPIANGTASAITSSPIVVTSSALSDSCVPAPSGAWAWSLLQKPAGSAATLSSLTSRTTGFTPDAPGVYQLSVVVTDNAGLSSAPGTLTFTVANCGSAKPVIAVGGLLATAAHSPANAGDLITLQAANALGGSTISDLNGSSCNVVSRYTGDASTTAFATTLASPTVFVNGALKLTPSDYTVAGGVVTFATAPAAGAVIAFSAFVPGYQYRWSLLSVPSGSSAQLSSATAAAPEFAADVPNGTYQVALTVTDSLGNVSDPAFLGVPTSKCGVNLPLLVLDPTLSVNANTAGTLNATATDADNACAGFATDVTQIAWSVVSSPAGSRPALTSTSTATVKTGTGAASSYAASNQFQADVGPGIYVVQAQAIAANGLKSAPQQSSVTVSACGASVPAINALAATDAANPLGVARPPVGDTVTVTASATDPDHDTAAICSGPLSAAQYLWSVTAAPAGYVQAVPIPAGLTTRSVTLVPNVAGVYTLSAVAVSATGIHSAPLAITIPTGSCFPSVANTASSGAPISASTFTPTAGTSVTLGMGVASSACVSGGAAPTVAWSILSRPAGSGAALSGSTTTAPTFTADVPGTYAIQLVVTDNGGFTNAYSTTVTAGACVPPSIVNAGAQLLTAANLYTVLDPQSASTSTIYSGGRVTLALPVAGPTAGGAVPGSCGGVAGYQWSLISRPSGSQALLSSRTDSTPSFVADVANGSYQLSVVIKDAQGNASAPFFFNLDSSTCGTLAPSFAGSVTFQASPRANAAFTVTAPAPTDPQVTAGCPARFRTSGYSYAYSITAQPAGSAASISGTTGTANMLVNSGGAYTVAVVATNTLNGLSTAVPATGSLAGATAVSGCSTFPPVANAFSVSQSVPLAAGGSATLSDASLAAAGANASAGGAALSSTNYYLGLPVAISTPGGAITDANVGGACATYALAAPVVRNAWAIVAAPPGSHATLGSSNTGTVVFTPDASGAYTVALTTSDAAGYASTGTVRFNVPCGSSLPTISGNSASQVTSAFTLPVPGQNRVAVGAAVGLDAAASDPDSSATAACTVTEAQPLTYQWAFTSIPSGSKTTLLAAGTRTASFTPDTVGPYTLQLTVTDPQGNSFTQSNITWDAQCNASAPAVVLNAGTPEYVATQSLAVNGGQTLAITRSTDPLTPSRALLNGVSQAIPPFYPFVPVQLSAIVQDADSAGSGVAGCGVIPQSLTYRWSISAQPSGSVAQIGSPTAQSPSFTPDLPGAYAFQLVVTDQSGRSTTNTLSAAAVATVGTCGTVAPIAVAKVTGPIPAPSVGVAKEPVGIRTQLDGTGSTASDNTGFLAAGAVVPASDFPAGCGLRQALSYSWSLSSTPTGATATLTGATLLDPSFVPDVPGTWALDVAVSDGRNTSHAQTSVLSVGGYLSAPGTTNASYTATALDSSGNPVVVWLDGVTNALNAARCTSGCAGPNPIWQALPNIDTNIVVAPPSATDEPRPIAVATSGANLLVAYYTGSGATGTGRSWAPCEGILAFFNAAASAWTTRYIGERGNACDAAFTTGSAVGRYFAAQTDPVTGRFEVAFSSQSINDASPPGTPLNSATIRLTDCAPDISSCNANQSLVAAAAPIKLGRWVSLKAEPSGVYAAAFYVEDDGTGAKGLRFARCTAGACFTGGAWTTMNVDFAAGVDQGRFASVDAIPGNTDANPGAAAPSIPVIAYRDQTDHVAKFARCTAGCTVAGDWTASVVADASSSDYGAGTQVAVSPATGYLRLAYVDVAHNLVRVLAGSGSGSFSETAEFGALGSFGGLSMVFSGGTRLSFNGGSGLRFFAGP